MARAPVWLGRLKSSERPQLCFQLSHDLPRIGDQRGVDHQADRDLAAIAEMLTLIPMCPEVGAHTSTVRTGAPAR